MRLAGTCSAYSNNAMPQLNRAAMYHGAVARFLRWPYQAKVMKILLPTSNKMVCKDRGMDWNAFIAPIIPCSPHPKRKSAPQPYDCGTLLRDHTQPVLGLFG